MEEIRADERNLYVVGLPQDVRTTEFIKLFSSFGDILAGRVIRKSPFPNRVYGFIMFRNKVNAGMARRYLDKTNFKGCKLRVVVATGVERKTSGNMYFGNLPPSWETEDLRNLCSPFGILLSVRVITNRYTSTGCRYGFVRFASESVAVEVERHLDGHLFTDCKERLIVQKALLPADPKHPLNRHRKKMEIHLTCNPPSELFTNPEPQVQLPVTLPVFACIQCPLRFRLRPTGVYVAQPLTFYNYPTSFY